MKNHRKLIFHWTKLGREILFPRNHIERCCFVDHLSLLLNEGLKYSVPGPDHHDYIVKDEFDPKWPMICFTESTAGETDWHAERYGSLGLGFTRKFIFQNHGRPVAYFDRQRTSPFLKTLLKVLRAGRKSGSPDDKHHLDILCAHFKAYKMPIVKKAQGGSSAALPRVPRVTEEGDDLHIRFGGPRTNLEDREWRILQPERIAEPAQRLKFEAGELALVVLPDHATLSLALKEPKIVEKLHPKGRPAVCLVSREMLPSIAG